MKYDTQKDSKGALEARRSVTEKKITILEVVFKIFKKGDRKG